MNRVFHRFRVVWSRPAASLVLIGQTLNFPDPGLIRGFLDCAFVFILLFLDIRVFVFAEKWAFAWFDPVNEASS